MLSRPFLVLALAMFMATMGIGMVTPILPVHARSLGASGAAIGLTFSSFAITQVLISPFAGRIADRYGRKPFLVAGLLTYVVAALGWWLADDIVAVILLRAFTGIGSALIFSLAQAYVGDLAPSGYEGRYMGTFGVFDFMGFGAGPLVAGLIRDATDLRTTFLAMAGLFVAASTLVAVLLPRRHRRADGSAVTAVPVAPWATILSNPYVQSIWVVRVAFSFSIGASLSFIAVYMEEELLATATMVGALLAGQQLTSGSLQPVIGAMADRVGRRQLVAGGAALVALGYAVVWASESYAVILGGVILGVGVGGAMVNVTAQALMVDIGRRLGMATLMSLNSMGFAVGILLGSLGGGLVVEAAGVRSVFLVAGGALLAGAVTFLVRTAGRPVHAVVVAGAAAVEDEAASG